MKQTIAIILSIFLLISSSGITYAQHICGDYIMMEKVTFGEQEMSCGMAMSSNDCDGEEESHGCCDNHYFNISTDDNFAQTSFDVVLTDHFVAAFVSVFVVQSDVPQKETSTQYTEYNPPPLLKDIPVLYETFLI